MALYQEKFTQITSLQNCFVFSVQRMPWMSLPKTDSFMLYYVYFPRTVHVHVHCYFFLPGYVTAESPISFNISLKTKMKKLIQFFMYHVFIFFHVPVLPCTTIALFCLFLSSLKVIYLGGMRGKNWAVLYLSSQQVQHREAQRQHLLISVLPSTSTLCSAKKPFPFFPSKLNGILILV